jgi:hypothetical protein
MSDGIKYEGIFKAKLDGNIYLTDGSMLYELPIQEIVEIENNGINITEVIINSDDNSSDFIKNNKLSVYKYSSNENEDDYYAKINQKRPNMSHREIYNSNRNQGRPNMSHHDIDNANGKEVLLNMSDREFAIYELDQKQRQAEMVSRKIDGVSATLWATWGLSIGIYVATTFIVLNQ